MFWYAAVFGTITAISRAAVTDELLVLDPEGAMSMVVQHTHYMPKRWRGKENTEMVRIEFETLFQVFYEIQVSSVLTKLGVVCLVEPKFPATFPLIEPLIIVTSFKIGQCF